MRAPTLCSIAVASAFFAAACGKDDASSAGTQPTGSVQPVAAAVPPKPIALAGPATYESMQPYLAAKCNCHVTSTMPGFASDGSPRRASGDFDLSSYGRMIKGGAHGVAVKPGDPEGSALIAYLRGTKKPKMPRGGSLPDADIQIISDWIKDGAKEK